MNRLRVGNFTSSEIGKLMKKSKSGGFGAPALTYIEEKNMERRLGRSLGNDQSSKPTTWGTFMETRVFSMLGDDYKACSTETITHPGIPFWSGSADGHKDNKETVFEVKCPMTLKSFCHLVQPLYDGLKTISAMDKIRELHDKGDEYYWQIVSNAVLAGSKYGELVVYCPYQSELDEIRTQSLMSDAGWIVGADDKELPYLIDNGYYKNLNKIRFEIPEEDKSLLTNTVLEAGKLLQKQYDQDKIPGR